MCGIVGYSGNLNGINPVIEGLTRLEYRGYDSAGVCFKNQKELSFLKKEGKIDNLKEVLSQKNPESNVVIGHTRWATHGKVNDTNAHPHVDKDFAIVHNGIIENANQIKEKLISQGVVFESETDSEVFLRLLVEEHKKCKSVLEAVANTFKQVEGNSAFVIMNTFDDNIYSVKRSAPLVCGENLTTKEVFCSSDPYALIGFATKIYFPQDEVICVSGTKDGEVKTLFYELNLKHSGRFDIQGTSNHVDVASKGNYEHYMIKEIYEQPGLIGSLYTFYLEGMGREALDTVAKLSPEFVHISACGTAWHAGLLIRNFLETHNNLRVGIELASEFRYKGPLLRENDMGLFITQSGETADTLASLKLCKEHSVKTLSIVNVDGSTIHRESDVNLLTRAGAEIGVASTKAFTMQVLTGYLMSKAMQGELSNNEIKKEFYQLANAIESILARENEVAAMAKEIHHKKGFIFTGRGKYYPIALEGALKLKEISYVHAEGYAAGELKHGPIAIIDEDIVNICLIGPELYEKAVSNMEEVKARRGLIVSVGPLNDKHLKETSDYYFGVPLDGLNDLAPVCINIVMQLLSYHIAKLKGTDIDKPRNLAKSVTVE